MPTSLERHGRFVQPPRATDEDFHAVVLFSALGLIITCAVVSLIGAEALIFPIE